MYFIKKRMNFSKILRHWYLQNKRDLPWRNTVNPYYIWLSEIILQQTRVSQGLSYYFKFIEHFPAVIDLAFASEEQVLKLWQGLGYYSRARNLHFTAKYIVNELHGVFPTTYTDIIKLKGVGDYTASAIASICFNEATAVVDGNVYRVLARYFGINTPINSSKGKKEFKQLAQQLLNKKSSGEHNQAIMEFGARMCKPQNPNCIICPLQNSCIAQEKKLIKVLPVKENRIKIRNRYFNYLVIHTANNKTNLIKREKGIWINLYEFPLIETSIDIDEKQLIEHEIFNELFEIYPVTIRLFNKKVIVHKLSHQHIHTKFWIVTTGSSNKFSISWDSVNDYPVSALIDKFLSRYNYH